MDGSGGRRGRPLPLGRRRCAAFAVALALLATGCSAVGRDPGSASQEPTRQLDGLALVVRPKADGSYRRAEFGTGWTDVDNNGCNQRDDALFRDVHTDTAFRVQRQGSCDHDMLAGSWTDPYSGEALEFGDLKDPGQARSIQIDHIVALAVAWRYGARSWDKERRLTFANDLTNLVPVSAHSNESKSGQDAAAWRPKLAGQCAFASRYVQVKARYSLPVDISEQRALRDMLDTCS